MDPVVVAERFKSHICPGEDEHQVSGSVVSMINVPVVRRKQTVVESEIGFFRRFVQGANRPLKCAVFPINSHKPI